MENFAPLFMVSLGPGSNLQPAREGWDLVGLQGEQGQGPDDVVQSGAQPAASDDRNGGLRGIEMEHRVRPGVLEAARPPQKNN